MREVEVGLELLRDALMLGELAPVVTGDRLDLKRRQLHGHGLSDQLRGVVRDTGEARQFRLALNQTDDGLLMIAPDDSIGFPVTQAALLGNDLGALGN